jgi:hypothetical protein
VRLERTLEDTRFDFFIEAADRKLRDALDGMGDASMRAGRSEQRVNVINKVMFNQRVLHSHIMQVLTLRVALTHHVSCG